MAGNTGICRTGICAVINMMVTSAYTCCLHLDQNLIITGYGNRDFTHFCMMRLYNHYFLHRILHFLSFPGHFPCPEKFRAHLFFL